MRKLAALFLVLGAVYCLDGQQRVPVVLELFTSEGCSSCPPADRLIAALDKTQPISGVEVIVLSEHVDYWNQLGWKDPYSAHLFSERQSEYAEALHVEDIYTPQALIDGHLEAVGSNSSKVSEAIEHAAHERKLPLALIATRTAETMQVHLTVTGDEIEIHRSTLYLALAENAAESQVSRGENAGHSLTHVSVVRRLVALDKFQHGNQVDTVLKLDSNWGAHGLRVIAFLQEKSSRRIVGAAMQASN